MRAVGVQRGLLERSGEPLRRVRSGFWGASGGESGAGESGGCTGAVAGEGGGTALCGRRGYERGCYGGGADGGDESANGEAVVREVRRGVGEREVLSAVREGGCASGPAVLFEVRDCGCGEREVLPGV